MLVCISAARWRGSAPDGLRLDAAVGGHARHLDAAVGGQVVDQRPPSSVFGHVAVERERLAGLAGVDDVGAVLGAALDAHRRVVRLEARAQVVPLGDLALAAVQVLVERDVEPLDQVRAGRP